MTWSYLFYEIKYSRWKRMFSFSSFWCQWTCKNQAMICLSLNISSFPFFGSAYKCLWACKNMLMAEAFMFWTWWKKYMIAEGRGSLLFYLKSRGWASSISAGVGDEGMNHSSIAYVFGMSIHLTDSGLEKVIFFLFLH